MTQIQCPDCGANEFYVKDPQDKFNIFEFNLVEDKIVHLDVDTEEPIPNILDETHTYCQRCSWHGKFKILQQGR